MKNRVTERDQLHPFRAARWLPGPHAQTFWAQASRSRWLVDVHRESLATPDGDQLFLDGVAGDPGSPLLLILHGLEGCSFSPYAQGMMKLARQRGWQAKVLNFRSCARRLDDRQSWIPNARPRLYHSGETTDLDHVLRTLSDREPETKIFAVGVSLGGNVLLKWLGEHPDQTLVEAAASISTPYDLAAASRHLERPLGKMYVRFFLKTLVQKLDHLVAAHPQARASLDLEAAKRARGFLAYDHAATAPLHGFDSADDYYQRSSSIRFIDAITTPTLCLSAADDPFLPVEILDKVRDAASAAVELDVTDGGGHVAFIAGRTPLRPLFWAEARVFEWFQRVL